MRNRLPRYVEIRESGNEHTDAPAYAAGFSVPLFQLPTFPLSSDPHSEIHTLDM